MPSFRYNLLSVDKFVKQFQSILLFTSTGCLLQAPFIKRAQAFGEAKDGLFLLQPSSTTHSYYFRQSNDILVPDKCPESVSVSFCFSQVII